MNVMNYGKCGGLPAKWEYSKMVIYWDKQMSIAILEPIPIYDY